MAHAADPLELLNQKLADSREARGVRGGLGRVKGQQVLKVPLGGAVGAGFLPQNRVLWEPAGQDPLYRRFTRGPVLGAGQLAGIEADGDGDGEVSVWRVHIEAALADAGGALPWRDLVAEATKRRRASTGGPGGADEAAWQQEALASIPEAFLSREDALVRLPGEGGGKRAKR